MPVRGFPSRLIAGLVTLSLVVLAPCAAPTGVAAQAPTAQALHIAVLDGEDAVNIIQQRTAVAPVVQVTDTNGQPVAGATVRFAIRAGKATFKGARTLTVTTDSAGRAVAMGLSPTGAGSLEIGATATFQGQAAVATITQTNVMTAAQAAAAGGAGAGSGAGSAAGASAGTGGAASGTAGAGATGAGTTGTAAGAAAAGGAVATGGAAAGAGTVAAGAAAGAAAAGGGIGLTTIAIAGAAVAGGTYAATKVVGGGGDQPQLKGTFSSQMVVQYVVKATGAIGCARTNALNGAFTFDYRESNGTIEGEFDDETDWRVVANTCADGVGATSHSGYQLKVSGSPSSITGTGQRTGSPGAGATVTDTFQFSGSLAGGVLTGTYTMSTRIDFAQEVGTGSAAIPATLR